MLTSKMPESNWKKSIICRELVKEVLLDNSVSQVEVIFYDYMNGMITKKELLSRLRLIVSPTMGEA